MRLRTALSAVACAAASAAGAQAAQLNVITRVQVQDAGKEVLVSIAGSKPPNFTTFSMMDPPRFVVDVSEGTFKNVPADITGGSELIKVVKNLSYGSEATSIARVMIAFSREVDPPDVQTAGNDLVVRIAKPPEVLVAQKAPPAPAAVAQATPAPAPAAPGPAAVPAAAAPAPAAPAAAAPAPNAAEQARLEAEEQARWEAKARAEAEASAKAEQEARGKAEALASAQAQQEKAKADEEARARAEAEARAGAEQEARAKAEALASAQAQQEKAKADEDARARREAEEERRARREEEKARREAAAVKVASVPPSEPRRETLAPGVPNQVREVGFRQMPGASRVFVRTAHEPHYTIMEAGENVIRVELANTRVRRRNDARFMDTSFFQSAVAMVTPMRAGSTYVVEIKLKERVPYQQKVEGDVLSIDFERPAAMAAPSGQAAPREPAAAEAPPGQAPAAEPAPAEPGQAPGEPAPGEPPAPGGN